MNVPRKWRPRLWLVLGGGLLGTLALSFLGLVALRYLGPEIGFRQAVVVLALAILAGTAVLGWLIHRLIHRPLTALASHANAIRLGQPPPPAPHHIGTVEGRDLAVAVLSMADRLGDRAASLSSFADHVMHEMKTPVTSILAASELLEDAKGLSPEDARVLTQITAAARQIQGHLTALRRVTEVRETTFRGTSRLSDVLPALRQVYPLLDLQAEGAGHLMPLAAEGIMVILSQLFSNAEKSGAGVVRVTALALPDQGALHLTIRDDGPGVSPGNRDRIFDPFFTTRRDQGGTGMGLSIVRTALLANGGTIRLLQDGPGAGFEIRFADRGW
jgi:two-component system OmpR family sensor kinase